MSAAAPRVSRLARATEVLPLVAFRGLNGGLPILLGLYVGHRWGLAELGAYTLASSFVAIGLMFVDWGCTRWLPRDLSLTRLQEGAGSAVATANSLRLLLAATFLLLTWLLTATGHIPSESARFAAELGLLYPISIFSVNGVSDRIVTGAIGGIGGAVAAGLAIFGVAAGSALYAGAGPHALVLAFVTGKAFEALLLMRGRGSLFRFDPRRIVPMAIALWPFSMQAILAVIYSRLSVFIVEHFRHADLGLVGVATAMQNVFLLLPISIGLLKYPVFTTAAALGEMHRIRTALASAAAMSLSAVAAGIAVLFAARGLVGRLLHVEPPLIPFIIAFVAIAALTTGTALSGLLLQALGHERTTARLSVVTLSASLLSQYMFVRWLGLWGVAAGIAVAEVVSLTVFGTAAVRVLRGKVVRPQAGRAIDVPSAESLIH